MQRRLNERLNSLYIFMLIFFMLFIKIVSFSILPEKYFYDSKRIFQESIVGVFLIDKSYNFASKFFSIINIFKISDFKIFSITIAILFTIVIIKYYKFKPNNLILDSVLIILIAIYVLGTTKEIIQLIINILFYKIIISNKSNNLMKFIFTSILFIFFSYFFRSYLILQYISMVLIFLFVLTKENKIKSVFILLILVLFLLNFIKNISYENYIKLINIRYEINVNRMESLDANTMILDLVNNYNNSSILFLINYMINLLRLLFPIELIFKGIKYIPYVLFQFYISHYLIKFIKYVDLDRSFVYIYSFLISFYIISALFEPDYGSFLRHQTVILFIFKHLYDSVKNNNTFNKIEKM